jgi:hypothetical protein
MKRDDLRARTFLRVLQAWYESRGTDIWKLPLQTQLGLWEVPDIDNAYSREILEPLMRKLRAGQFRQVLDDIRDLRVDHPLLPALRIVALSYAEMDEESFSAFITAGSSQRAYLVSGVWAIEASLAGSTHANEYLARVEQGSAVGRFAAAITAVAAIFTGREQGSLRTAVEALEPPLRAGAVGIRRAATDMVLELTMPLTLAYLREYELCGRIIALLEPAGSGALSFNLAAIAMRAWADDRIAETFHQRLDRVYVLARGLGALAKLGLLLIAYDQDEDKPADLDREIPASFEEFFAQDGLRWSELEPADQAWSMVIIVLLMQESKLGSVLPALEGTLMAQSAETRLLASSALHAGVLQWVATGRDLSPIMASMAFERRLTASFGIEPTIVVSPDPDATYVRLSMPERAMVRELAKLHGLEHRHAALCELSSEDA